VELNKVYRQKDTKFIELLNQIRNNTITEENLNLLNYRVGVEFHHNKDEFVVYLTTLNEVAYKINNEYLNKSPGKLYQWVAEIQGEFDRNSLPADYELNIRQGAQVMMLNNDPQGRWVNGSLGRVLKVRYKRRVCCNSCLGSHDS